MSLDDFIGTKDIMIQSNSDDIPYTFTFSVCSSATANDGFLPYGTNINSVVVTSKTSAGVAVLDLISEAATEAANVVIVKLQYPTTSGVGVYHLIFALTLDNGDASVLHAEFKRVYVE